MTTEPMFTPPTSDLIRQWMSEAGAYQQECWYYEENLVTQAAEWGYQQGADTELNECCKWLPNLPPWSADNLRKHRRPKPPSLKEQALVALNEADEGLSELQWQSRSDIIRRALETLPND